MRSEVLVRVDGCEPLALQVDGLHCVALGRGQPVVALHPGPGFDHELFRPWLDPLAEYARLVYFDFSGNGRSRRPSDWAALSPESMIEDIETVRRSLGLDRAVLFAHCASCTLALMYARRYPERVMGLVLCAGAPAMDFAEELEPLIAERASPQQLAAIGRLYSEPYSDDETFRDDLMVALPLYFHRAVTDAGEDIASRVHFSGKAWVSFRDRHLATFSCLGWLPEIKTPALVVSGAHDLLFPVEYCAGRMAQALPNAQFHLFEHSGHMPFVEETEPFVSVVSDWIGELATR